MSSVIAIVKSVIGQVVAISPEGVQRQLFEGDRIFQGDQIDTGSTGMVTIELNDGRLVDLGRETHWNTAEVAPQQNGSEQVAQAPSTDELQKAIAAGADPTQSLEAPAAGPGSAGGTSGPAGGSRSFVLLDATAERVDAQIGYETEGLTFNNAALEETRGTVDTNFAPEFVGANGAPTNALDVTTDEDTPLTGTLTARDANGDLITYTVVGGPANGTLTLTPNGTWTYTPNQDYNGPDRFQVTASDSRGGSSQITVNVGVNPVNDAPVADPVQAVNLADTSANDTFQPVTGQLAATDVDDTNLTWSGSAKGNYGELTVNPDGSYSYVVDSQAVNALGKGESDSESFTVTVKDPSGASDTAVITINLTGANDAPVVIDTSVTVAEKSTGTALNIAAPTDIDAHDILTITVSELPTIGQVTLANGTAVAVGQVLTSAELQGLKYDGPADYKLGDPVGELKYTVNDGTTSVEGKVTLGVTPENDAPVANNDFGVIGGLKGSYYAYREGVDGTNLENLAGVNAFIAGRTPSATFTATELSYGNGVSNDLGADQQLQKFLGNDATSLSTDPANSSDAIIQLTGNISLDAGTYQFKVAADDGFSIRIDGKVVAEFDGNQSPTEREFPTFTINESGAHQIEIIYWDQGSNAQLKIELRPEGGAYTVVGGSQLSHAGNDVLTTDEDQPLVIEPSTLLGNDTDADGDTLSISSVQGAVNGTVELVNGKVVFTPTANFNGTGSFTYTVTDGNGGSDTATVTVGVRPVNDAPVVDSTSLNVNEESVGTALNLKAPTDADNNPLTIKVTGLPTLGTVTLADGTAVSNNQTLTSAQLEGLKYNAPADYNAGDAVGSFTYSVNDGSATVNGSVTLSVNPINDLPVVSSNAITVNEESVGTSLGLKAPTDADGDVLTIRVTGLPTVGTVTLADGTAVSNNQTLTSAQLEGLKYNAPADYNAGDAVGSFTYSVNDGTATVNGSVTLSVNPINDLPVVSSNAITVNEESVGTSLGLKAPTDADGDALTIRVTGLPTVGTVTLADGTAVSNNQTLTSAQLEGLKYNAPADYNAGDAVGSFTYSVNDGSATVNGSVTLSVNPINDLPVVSSNAITVNEESVGTSLGLKAPTDADGDALTIRVTGLPTVGSVTLADGTVVSNNQTLTSAQLEGLKYNAPADYNAGDAVGSFTYSVNDGTATVNGSVTLSVNPINDLPVVSSNAITVNEESVGTSLGLKAPTDADGDALTIRVTGLPTVGSVTLADGTVVSNNQTLTSAQLEGLKYNAPADYNAGDAVGSFTYSVNDGTATVNGSVTLSVNPINDLPTATPISESTNEDASSFSIDLLSTAQDADNDALSVENVNVTGGDASGVSFNARTNSLDVDPSAYNYLAKNQNITLTYTYDVVDGKGGVIQNTASLTIAGRNDAPVMEADGIAIKGQALANHDLASAINLDGTFVVGTNVDVQNAGTVPFVSVHATADGAADFYTFTVTQAGTKAVFDIDYAEEGGFDSELVLLDANGKVLRSNDDNPSRDSGSLSGLDSRLTYTFDQPGTYYIAVGNASAPGLIPAGSTYQLQVSLENAIMKVDGVTERADGSADENSGNLTTSGLIGFTDVDLRDTHTVSVTKIDAIDSKTGAATSPLGTLTPVITEDANGKGIITWIFSVAAGALDHLAAGQTITQVYQVAVNDGTASATKNVTITLIGTNDVAVIGGTDSGSVTEDTGVVNGLLTSTGTLTISDADSGESVFVAGNGKAVGTTLGSLSIGTDGSWTYNVANGDVQYLKAGEQRNEAFVVKSADGTEHTVTVTITGANDVAKIAGTAQAGVTEDTNVTAGKLTTSGVLNVSDDDAGESSFIAGNGTPVGTTLGSLSIGTDGTWTYNVANADVQYLKANQTRDERFVIKSADGTEHTVTVTITGTNDAPQITGGAQIAGSVTERVDGSANENTGNLTTSGTIGFTDVDLNDSHSITFSLVSVTDSNTNASTTALGSFTPTLVEANGSGTISWNYSVPAEALDYLSAGQTVKQVYQISLSDNQGGIVTQNVTVTLVGTNDAPVISASNAQITGSVTERVDGSANENTGSLTASGNIGFADVDLADSHTVSATLVSATDSKTGATTALGSLTPTFSEANGSGTVTWNFSVAAQAVDYLAAGQTVTQVYQIAVSDGKGGTATQNVTVTLVGTNDAPVVSSNTISATEQATQPIALGIAAPTDVDTADTLTIKITGLPTLGTVVLANGNVVSNGQTLTVAQLTGLQYKAPADYTTGQKVGDFTYTVTDSSGASNATSTGKVTINVTAINDVPVANDDGPTVTGLQGNYYGYKEGAALDGNNLTNLAAVREFIATHNPNATFTSTSLNYGNGVSNNLGTSGNLAKFLGTTDASSIKATSQGLGTTSDAIVQLKGEVNLAQGTTYKLRVTADDGYSILIDGKVVAEYNGNQSPTPRASDTFTISESGVHSIEIIYWDQGGQSQLKVEISSDGGTTYNVLGGTALAFTNNALVTNEDTDLTITAKNLLANDTDADGDTLSINSVTNGVGGTVSLVNGNVVFKPTANFNGEASFTYTVKDPSGAISNPATVKIQVNAVNDLPTSQDGSVQVGSSGKTFSASDFVFSDVDTGDSLKAVRIDSLPTSGSLTLNGNAVTAGTLISAASIGNLVYTPAAAGGDSSFKFSVQDQSSAFSATNYTMTLKDAVAPTVSSITLADPSLQIGETSTVTITFSEKVTGFDKTDVTVQNGTLGDLTSTDGGKTWTGTFTPSANIENTSNVISVANTYTDVAGNTGTAGSGGNYAVDTKAPTVASIVMSDSSLQIGETSTVTITFSEKVTGFDKTDVTVQNGTLGDLTSADGGKTWTGTFTPSANIENTNNAISVADTYTDVAGNAGTAGAGGNYAIDTKAPTATITMSDTALKMGETSTVTITFSENVTGFSNADVTVQNGTLSTLTTADQGKTWTGTFTPSANVENASNSIGIIDKSYTDLAGNYGGAASISYAVDTKAPTVASITLSDSSLQIGETSTVTISFSESVTGFDKTDVTVQNGTLGDLTSVDGGVTWTGIFTPSANIENTSNVISVANTYSDAVGNTGTAATSSNYAVDTKAPTATITMSDTALKMGETSTVTITFSENVIGFTNADVTVQNGTLSTLTTADQGKTWTGTFTPSANVENASNSIGIIDKSYTDLAGNQGSAANVAYAIDTKAPTAAIAITAISEDTGTPGDFITRDSTLTVSGTVGTLTSSEHAQISIDNGATWSNLTVNNGAWSYTDGRTLSLGDHTYQVRVVDDAGNLGNSATQNVTITANHDPIAVNDPGTSLGLSGQYYAYHETGTSTVSDGPNLTSLAQVNAFIAANSPDASFVAKTISYSLNDGNLGGNNNLQTFLGTDSASLNVDPENSSDAIIRLAGTLQLNAGSYQLNIRADDGYSIAIDGVVVAKFDGNQSPASNNGAFTINESGSHSIEIIYWDQGGQAVFQPTLSFNGGTAQSLSAFSPAQENTALVTKEDTPLTISAATLLGNDSDADNDTLTISSVGNASHGSAVLQSNGSVLFTPAADYYGPATFSYTLSDGHGGTSTATVTVNVNAVNDAPTSDNKTVETNEDTAITFKASDFAFHDVDAGDSLKAIRINTLPTSGSLSLGNTAVTVGMVITAAQIASLVYTPAANAHDKVSFSFSVQDQSGAFSAQPNTMSVDVLSVDDAPGLSNSTVTFAEDIASGTRITDMNDRFTGTDQDRDGEALTYSITGGNASGLFAINAQTGVITLANGKSLDYETATQHQLQVSATDGKTPVTATVTINVSNVNDNPVVVSDADTTANFVNENAVNGTAVGLTVRGTDADTGTTVTYTLTDNAGGRFAINATTGIVTVADGSKLDYESATSHTITALATSSDGSTKSETFTIQIGNVNDNPVVVSDADTTANFVNENAANGTAVGLTVRGTDADTGTTVTYTLTDNAGGRFAINATNGIVTVADGSKLDYESATSHTITALATSSDGSTKSETFTIQVGNLNDNPVLITDINAAANEVNENAANGTAVGLTVKGSDADAGTTVTYSLTNSAGGRFAIDANTGVVTVANGTLLNYEAATSHSITVLATSSDGSTNSANYTIAVKDVNEAPVVVAGAAVTGTEDTNYVFKWSDFKVSDVDANSALSIKIESIPVEGKLQQLVSGSWVDITGTNTVVSQATIAANGLRFVPATNASGSDSSSSVTGVGNNKQTYAEFKYSGSDGSLSSASSTMSVDITPVADMPTLSVKSAAASTLFITGWESVANSDNTSQSVTGSTLEGWTLVTTGDKLAGGTNVFEVWAAGDSQQRSDNNYNTVAMAPGDGKNALELNDAGGTMAQTLGITRSIATEVGKVYDLSLDYAGRPGYGTEYTKIAVYLGTTLVGEYSSTSPVTSFNWENLHFSFVGTGNTEQLTIKLSGTATDAAGRGALIDDIKLSSELGVVAGEGGVSGKTTISLANYISGALTDTDGSESLKYDLSSLPSGSSIIVNGATRIANSDGVVSLTPAELAVAKLQLSSSVTGDIGLDVKAYSFEGNSTATTPVQHLDLTILASGVTHEGITTTNTITSTVTDISSSNLGLSGEYYGYNESGKYGNLDSLADVKGLIEDRSGNSGIVGTTTAAKSNTVNATFTALEFDYGFNAAGGIVFGNDLGQNRSVSSGNNITSGTDNNPNNLYRFLTADGTHATDIKAGGAGLGDTTDAAIRAIGYLGVTEGGTYDIRITADDGYRLSIGGNAVATADYIQSTATKVYTGVALTSGMQPIEILYWDQGGNATLKIELKLSGSADSTYKVLGTDDFALFKSSIALTADQELVDTGSGTWAIHNMTTTGTDANDLINGSAYKDILNGGKGHDVLYGNGGNDILNGGDGNDILIGGTGNDTLTGGNGADLFIWKSGDIGKDVITDFNASEGDRIDLSDLLPDAATANGHADLLSYLKVDTATSTLQISTTGHVDTASQVDVTIKLDGVDLSHYGSTSSQIVNSLVAGADPLVKVDHN